MRVNNFKIKWTYSFVKKQNGWKKPSTSIRRTTCQIINETGNVVCEETTTLNIRDQDNKETARKISLSKVLSNLPKEERAAFWDVYRNLKKTPRW